MSSIPSTLGDDALHIAAEPAAVGVALKAGSIVATRKVRNGNYEIVSGDVREIRVEGVEGGFPRISA